MDSIDLCSRVCIQHQFTGVSCIQWLPWELAHPGYPGIWLWSHNPKMAWGPLGNSGKALFDTCRLWNLLCWALHAMRRISGAGVSDEHWADQVKPCVKWRQCWDINLNPQGVGGAKCWGWGKYQESTGMESAQFMWVQGLWQESPCHVLCWASTQPIQIKKKITEGRYSLGQGAGE